MGDIINLFCTPIYKGTLSLNFNELKSYCYRFRDQDNGGCFKSNRNSYHSKALDFNNEILKFLHGQITDHATACVDKLDAVGNVKVDSMWININPPGGNNVAHIHPKSFMSGVLYIQTNDQTGNIYFENPNPVGYDWDSQFFKNVRWNRSCNEMWDFMPQDGEIYLFPSWAKHGVHTNMSNTDRISISFNIKL